MGEARNTKIQPGMRFGRLTIIERIPLVPGGPRNPRWLSLCDCGKEVESYGHNIWNGKTKSCGCLKKGPTNWKAVEKTTNKDGYVFIRMPDHPRASSYTGRVREHIVVMEKILGRHLTAGEEVHHKNGVRNDNRPENLELWNKSHPSGARVEDHVMWAKQLLEKYAPGLLKNTTQ